MLRFRYLTFLFVGFSLLIPATLLAADDGQADLDQATEIKLSASNLKDLEKVLDLCQSAIDKGLSDESKEFATELLASTAYEFAEKVSEPVFGQTPPDRRWQLYRQLAVPKLDQAIELKPNFAPAHFLKAKFLSLPNGDREEALNAIKMAVDFVDKDDPQTASDVYLWRANLADNNDTRREYLDKAIETNDKNLEALRVRAVFFSLNGETELAAKDFRQLIELEPENDTLQRALAETLINGEKTDEAEDVIDSMIEADPTSTVGYVLRARMNLVKEDADAALEDLSKALEIDPSSLDVLLLRTRVYMEIEDFEKAKDDINEVLDIRPGLIEGLLVRSLVYAGLEQYEDAAEDLELLVENAPDNTELQNQLAMIYYADDRVTKAIETYSRILARDEKNFVALRGRGDVFLGVGKHIDAAQDYERAYEVDEENSSLLNNYAWLLATSPDDEVRDGELSLKLSLKAAEITEYKQAHILSTLASSYAELGDFEKAREWAKKAVDAAEDDEQRAGLQEELDVYMEDKPWRERQETKDRIPSEAKSKTDL